jgi:polysaccharide chain length determinant protein (PEP-CTERM system associated)
MKDFRSLRPIDSPLDYLRIPWRRRWYVLAGFILAVAGAGIYSWRTPDVYRSESSVAIESGLISSSLVRPSNFPSPGEQIHSIRVQLKSRSFLQQIIQEFQLFGYGTDPNFSIDQAVAAVATNIGVANLSQNTFAVSYAATDPQVAQSITKRIADSLVQSQNRARKSSATETDRFLEDRLREAGQALSVLEEKIGQFKKAHLGELPEQSNANINALNGLNAQLASVENSLQQARDQQKMLEFRMRDQKQLGILSDSVLNSPAQTSSKDATGKEGGAVSNPLLNAKRAELAATLIKYTKNHPDVIRLQREVEELKRQEALLLSNNEASGLTALGETEKRNNASPGSSQPTANALLESTSAQAEMDLEANKNLIQKREKERDAILAQIKTYQNRLNMAPAVEQEFMSLSKEHGFLSEQYNGLKNKKFQAQMTTELEADSSSGKYRILDEANLPTKPVFPDRKQILLLGLGVGLVIGVVAAFGREVLDTTLGREDEVAAALKLPVLATISEIATETPRRQIKSIPAAKSA